MFGKNNKISPINNVSKNNKNILKKIKNENKKKIKELRKEFRKKNIPWTEFLDSINYENVKNNNLYFGTDSDLKFLNYRERVLVRLGYILEGIGLLVGIITTGLGIMIILFNIYSLLFRDPFRLLWYKYIR